MRFFTGTLLDLLFYVIGWLTLAGCLLLLGFGH
jgi:hypothetical protein